MLPEIALGEKPRRVRSPLEKLAKRHNRRARDYGATGKVTTHELAQLWKAQRGECALTGAPLAIGQNASLDHLIPLSDGGENSIGNVVFCHKDVNSRKQSYPLFEFVLVTGLDWRQIEQRIAAAHARLAQKDTARQV